MIGIFTTLKTVIQHCLTCIDGESYDIARVCWALGALFYIAFTAFEVFVMKKSFDPVNWSIGFGTIMAAASVSIKLKENSEPKE
jgi:hypothetical protein